MLAALSGCDGDVMRTLSLEVTGGGSAPVGSEITVGASMHLVHADSTERAAMSRLAVYVPEGPTVGDVVSGPTVDPATGLVEYTTILGAERDVGQPETLLEFSEGTIAPGEHDVSITYHYACARSGVAEIYVDVTFGSREPTDREHRREMVSVTCGSGIADGGASDAGGGGDAGGIDAGTSDAGSADAGASDAGASDASVDGG
ncbi:MAG: hypothetical protein AB7S26_02630 [Sandaracinaceae bacterium]